MSSHHFVREGQEPSLFIVDPVSYSIIAPLLEWVPLVITTQLTLDKVLSWGIKVDVILFSEDQRDETFAKTSDQWPIELVACNSEKDFFLTGLALLRDRGHQACHIMVENAKDVFERTLNSGLTISILDREAYWTFWNKTYTKYLPLGETIQFQGTNENQDFISGGKRILSGSYTVEFPHVKIESNAPFWVGEHHL
jgi:hypothetical protein